MARYVITDGTRWIQYKNGKYVPTSCPTFADEFSQKQAKSICENQLSKALRKVFYPEKVQMIYLVQNHVQIKTLKKLKRL